MAMSRNLQALSVAMKNNDKDHEKLRNIHYMETLKTINTRSHKNRFWDYRAHANRIVMTGTLRIQHPFIEWSLGPLLQLFPEPLPDWLSGPYKLKGKENNESLGVYQSVKYFAFESIILERQKGRRKIT